MSVGHYENFPVRFRAASGRFATRVGHLPIRAHGDDFADEGDLRPHERLPRLEAIARSCPARGRRSPARPFFQELSEVVAAHQLSLAPFHDLLDAFSQDVVKQRYANFAELMDYCRRSADPVGRLMLQLYGESDNHNIACSDAICSAPAARQLLADVKSTSARTAFTFRKRHARFGVSEDQIAACDASGGWWNLMRFQIEAQDR